MRNRGSFCKHCGNMVEMIKSSGAAMVCCGDPMTELVANTEDAAYEKHIPVVEIDGNKVSVVVGDVIHPMTPEHHIAWIFWRQIRADTENAFR